MSVPTNGATLDDVVRAVENLEVPAPPAPVGGALEATQEEVAANTAALNGVDFSDPTAGSVTTVSYSATAVLLLAANPLRKGLIVRNNADRIAYVNLSVEDPTSAESTLEIGARTDLGSGHWEDPFNYLGELNVIWASGGSGSMSITELT